MYWATGCAFNIDDLLIRFPYKRLTISCSTCKKINNDNHRDLIVKLVFKYCLKLIIEDLINNNITFWLPLTSNKKCNIHFKLFKGLSFKDLRKGGKWKDIDILKSNFSAPQLSLYLLGDRTPRVKSIYLNRKYLDLITKKVNGGFSYGDNKNDKYICDYYDDVQKAFPLVPMNDIKLILDSIWKFIYLHNSYGGDTLIQDRDIWFYIGSLRKDPLKHFLYYVKKLSLKLRILYRKKRILWDGYYYFALSEREYLNYISLKNRRGRPKKYYTFENIYIYLILDECKVSEYLKLYIFRLLMPTYIRLKYFMQKMKTDKAELIIHRNPLKFKDILVSDNEYEFI